MNRQTLAIIAVISTGSIISGLAYGVTNGSIITGDLTVTGTCTGCSSGPVINYTGDGSQNHHIISFSSGTIQHDVRILDLSNGGSFSTDGVTYITATNNYVYISSGENAYTPIRIINNSTLLTSSQIDVGVLYNAIQVASPGTKAVNENTINYQLVVG